MSYEEAVTWIKSFDPYMDDEEAYQAYLTFQMYREEGQSFEVSRQYAGF